MHFNEFFNMCEKCLRDAMKPEGVINNFLAISKSRLIMAFKSIDVSVWQCVHVNVTTWRVPLWLICKFVA